MLATLAGHCWQEQSRVGATMCFDIDASGRQLDVRFIGGGHVVLEARVTPTTYVGWLDVAMHSPGFPLRNRLNLMVDASNGSISWSDSDDRAYVSSNDCRARYRNALRQRDATHFELIRIARDSCRLMDEGVRTVAGSYVRVDRP